MLKSVISFGLCALMLMSAVSVEAEESDKTSAAAEPAGTVSGTYSDYLEKQTVGKAENGTEVILNSEQLSAAEGNFKKTSDGAVLIDEEQSLTVKFGAVPGLYNLNIDYAPSEGRSRNAEFSVKLNGSLPFSEAGAMIMTRLWRDKGGAIEEDTNNNDIRPLQEEVPLAKGEFLTCTASDGSGYQTEPLLFALDESNTLTLTLSRESVRIYRIYFTAPQETVSYSEYRSMHNDAKDASVSLGNIEAELPAWKSDSTLVAFADRSSPVTSPNKGAKISLNTIGGDDWTSPGQEIAWTFTPEQTGNYEIRFRARQNYSRGFYSARILKIDGRVPFSEAENLRFTYDSGWKIYTVSVGNEPCKFYFEEGKTYTLSLSVTLGDFGEVLGRAEECLSALNGIYRELLMIMGSSPDSLRDYNLKKVIPDSIEQLAVQADALDSIAKDIRAIAGFSGSELAILQQLSEQLRDFYDDTRVIAKRLGSFKNNIASLNTWMLDAKSQPLDLDWISVAAPGSELPKADAGFFASLKYMLEMFAASFTEDYNALAGEGGDNGVALEVWTTTGRDQASVLNDLIRSYYTPDAEARLGYPVNVSLRVVTADTILPSVAAKNGSDVLLNANSALPVNYATRKAAKDINTIADSEKLEEVLSHFRESALVPLRFKDGLYGLPEQQTYTVMYYRTDILSELGIPAPTLDNPWTWNDVIRYLPVLQKKNMSFLMDTGISAGTEALGTFAMFLYQFGGEFYEGDGIRSALSSETAINAFKYWTRFYTNYGLPTNFSIANRFRTGESPVVISDITLYNQLAVSAPEINGLWEIALVPGTVRADGTTDYSVSSGGTAAMILSSAKHPEAAFDFISWWTEKDIQSMFARNMESLLGASARYPTANIEAFEQLPWSLRDLRVLKEQAKWAKGIPEVPGGYYTSRHIKNAFRAVCISSNGEEPREALTRYAKIINDELYDKRLEFGLPVETD